MWESKWISNREKEAQKMKKSMDEIASHLDSEYFPEGEPQTGALADMLCNLYVEIERPITHNHPVVPYQQPTNVFKKILKALFGFLF